MSEEHPIAAGFSAGAVASVITSLISLPLVSPHDAIFNTATVTLGGVAAGAFAGVFWLLSSRIEETRHRYTAFGLGITLSFAVFALGVATPIEILLLDGAVLFMVPLAAIAFATIGVTVPILSRSHQLDDRRRRLLTLIVLYVVAIGIGIGLFMEGDAQVTDLELPPPGS